MKSAQSNKLFRPLELTSVELTALQHPVVVSRLTGEVDFANGALHRLLGHTRSSPAVATLDDLVVSDDLADLRTAWVRTAAGTADVALNVRLRCEAGGYRSVRLSLSLYQTPQAAPRVLAFITDLDEMQRGTEDVDRLRIALEGAGQGVWDHDMVRSKVYLSPTWYRMRGFEADEC